MEGVVGLGILEVDGIDLGRTVPGIPRLPFLPLPADVLGIVDFPVSPVAWCSASLAAVVSCSPVVSVAVVLVDSLRLGVVIGIDFGCIVFHSVLVCCIVGRCVLLLGTPLSVFHRNLALHIANRISFYLHFPLVLC